MVYAATFVVRPINYLFKYQKWGSFSVVYLSVRTMFSSEFHFNPKGIQKLYEKIWSGKVVYVRYSQYRNYIAAQRLKWAEQLNGYCSRASCIVQQQYTQQAFQSRSYSYGQQQQQLTQVGYRSVRLSDVRSCKQAASSIDRRSCSRERSLEFLGVNLSNFYCFSRQLAKTEIREKQ